MRYRLDDLGWYHFEKLTQALLKSRFGPALEAVGGRGDFGCDSYCPSSLSYPDERVEKEGPFIFQAKFIGNANAPGARSWPRLLQAIRAELERIRSRIANHTWKTPSVYTLLTNARVGVANRTKTREEMGAALKGCHVVILDGADICAHLDDMPNIRRAFPELLSIRDLDAMLVAAVNKDLLERSRTAVEEAREIAKVFVPTKAYDEARVKLSEYGFVVLDGPPEMGKTAIARVISIILLAEGWEVVECLNPDDVNRAYSKALRQLFVVDDAFGRTEFDITLGRAWERQLHHVLRKLDSNHWLVFTARKHILQRALRSMDLSGKAGDFPDPAEVLVDTTLLTLEEKARILYRHAKVACAAGPSKEIVKKYAKTIVWYEHFTPERIRRFVSNDLPALVNRDADAVGAAILSAIQDPTASMRKSFAALPGDHQWVLVLMLDFPFLITVDSLVVRYRASRSSTTPEEVLRCIEDLEGSFVRIYPTVGHLGGRRVSWVHPSYRDLIIEELSMNGKAQAEFLGVASLAGLRLAFSARDGEDGSARLPLLGTDESWRLAQERCQQFFLEGEHEAASLLLVLLDTLQGKIGQVEKRSIEIALESGWLQLCKMASGGGVASGQTVDLLCRVAEVLDRQAEFDIVRVWHESSEDLDFELQDSFGEYGYLEDWLLLCSKIEEYFGWFAADAEFRARREKLRSRIEAKIEEELDNYVISSEDSEAEHLRDIADKLRRSGMPVFSQEQVERWTLGLEEKADAVEEVVQEASRTDWSDAYESGSGTRSQTVDQQTIWAMFEDL